MIARQAVRGVARYVRVNGMLLPASMTATPEAFKGQLDGPGPSAGPFAFALTAPRSESC